MRWILRILVDCGGLRGMVGHSGIYEDLAPVLGLPLEWSNAERRPVAARIRRLHAAEERRSPPEPPGSMAGNLRRLSDALRLGPDEQAVLAFAVLLQAEPMLALTADVLGEQGNRQLMHTLSRLLHIEESRVQAALSPNGLLVRTGLVSPDRSNQVVLRSKLDLLSSHFGDALVGSDAEPVALLRDTVQASRPPHLGFADYAHISSDLDLMRAYLRQSLVTRRTGVNILIHGAPGVGKTELARLLAVDQGSGLYEIASGNDEGDAVLGEKRLRAHRAAQALFSQSSTMLLFDEAEDVFAGESIFSVGVAQRRKAWMNRMLEENEVPTIWLTNNVDAMDAAFVRRFDIVLELKAPSRRQREAIVRALSPVILAEPVVMRLASAPTVTPAVLARAVTVASAALPDSTSQDLGSAIARLVDSTLRAQGCSPLPKENRDELPEYYDPVFLNADTDLPTLAANLSENREARLLLHGPPGTGKSAFARWLGRELDMPLIVRRGSDLLGPFVGQTERNIAVAFRQAEDEEALLLIDEIDSLLGERGGGRQNWENSMVNELLIAMESYSGVLVATTNRMEALDVAAMRRFDGKIGFQWLRPDQARQLLAAGFDNAKFGNAVSQADIENLHLDRLGPGDIASILRRWRFEPVRTACRLVSLLERECEAKERSRRRIGFV